MEGKVKRGVASLFRVKNDWYFQIPYVTEALHAVEMFEPDLVMGVAFGLQDALVYAFNTSLKRGAVSGEEVLVHQEKYAARRKKIQEQYNWSGRYQQGWFNSWLGQAGVVQTTPGTNGSLGYNYIAKDDDVWVYTGVTSATSDNSIVGFVLVDQRTAESHYYAVAGATEASAMESAEGQVQNLRYVSTFPLLINVSNQPTYFMALKDAAGLVKKFAMIDIQRYQNVAVGDTVAECQKNYETLLATNGALSQADMTSTGTFGEANGTIRTIAQAVIEGNSHFYVTLEGDDEIYDFVLPGTIQIVGYAVGDEIAFSYVENEPTNTVSEITSNTVAAKVEEAASAAAVSASAASANAAEPAASGSSASASAGA